MSGTPFRGDPTSPLAIGRSPRQQLFMTHLPCLTARGRGEPTLISPVTVCRLCSSSLHVRLSLHIAFLSLHIAFSLSCSLGFIRSVHLSNPLCIDVLRYGSVVCSLRCARTPDCSTDHSPRANVPSAGARMADALMAGPPSMQPACLPVLG